MPMVSISPDLNASFPLKSVKMYGMRLNCDDYPGFQPQFPWHLMGMSYCKPHDASKPPCSEKLMGKLFWDALKSRWCGFGAFFDASALDIVFVHFLRRCKIVSVDCRLVSRVLNLQKSNFCSKAPAWTNFHTFASLNWSSQTDLPKQISSKGSSQTNLSEQISPNGSPQRNLPERISPNRSPRMDLPKQISLNGFPQTDVPKRISQKGPPKPISLIRPPRMDLPKRISSQGSL